MGCCMGALAVIVFPIWVVVSSLVCLIDFSLMVYVHNLVSVAEHKFGYFGRLLRQRPPATGRSRHGLGLIPSVVERFNGFRSGRAVKSKISPKRIFVIPDGSAGGACELDDTIACSPPAQVRVPVTAQRLSERRAERKRNKKDCGGSKFERHPLSYYRQSELSDRSTAFCPITAGKRRYRTMTGPSPIQVNWTRGARPADPA